MGVSEHVSAGNYTLNKVTEENDLMLEIKIQILGTTGMRPLKHMKNRLPSMHRVLRLDCTDMATWVQRHAHVNGRFPQVAKV